MSSSKPTVTLFSAPGCHLCEEAHAILDEFDRQGLLDLESVNIRTSPDLQYEFGLRIPVARFSGGLELGWPFTSEQVESVLASS
jgi:thiol-disulfide isomerase/thioredoxin